MPKEVMMLKNPLLDIVQVKTFSREYQVNERLSQGWVLLETYTVLERAPKDYSICFVVGRPASVEPNPKDDHSDLDV